MKLSDVFDVFNGMNVLAYITHNYAPHWKTSTKFPISETDIDCLDLDYFTNISGLKKASPLLEMLKEKNYTNNQIQQTVCKILNFKYMDNWNKAWDVFFETEYDPLNNYDRTEETKLSMHKGSQEIIEEEGSETFEKHRGTKETIGEDGTETLEKHKNSKEIVDDTRVNKFENKTFGDNSSVGVPSDEGTNQVLSGNLTTSFQDTDASNFDKDVKTFEDRETTRTIEDIDATHFDNDVHTFDDRKTTRTSQDIDANTYDYNSTDSRIFGNIGVTTSQQLGNSEFEYRKLSFFTKIVYPSLDEVLTCGIFE